MKEILLSIMVVLLISGCTIFGGDKEVKELPPDVIAKENVSVLPSSASVRPGDEFSIYMDIVNEDDVDAVPVNYSVYDSGLCTWIGGDPLNIDIGTSAVFGSLSPKEASMIEWNFKAPDSARLAGFSVTCPIRYKFSFNYTTSTQTDLEVIDRNYMTQLERSGQMAPFVPTINVGRGPIKVYFDFGTPLPVKTDSFLPVYLKVEDKGTGRLEYIDNGALEITFPSEFILASQGSDGICTYFSCIGNVCKNDEKIPLINKKTLEIRCGGIKTPVSIGANIPEKTYFITSTLKYDYFSAGQTDVKVEVES
jgi:hypothetical protein